MRSYHGLVQSQHDFTALVTYISANHATRNQNVSPPRHCNTGRPRAEFLERFLHNFHWGNPRSVLLCKNSTL